MMDRTKFYRLACALLVCLSLAACSGTETEVTPTPYPEEVDWETAVEILKGGNVEMAFQTHSLDVTLTMDDGSQIRTVEPEIDAIFAEIEQCGEPCSDIALATE